MRPINADALLKQLAEVVQRADKDVAYTGNRTSDLTWDTAVEYIKNAPTIKPEHKKGKWIYPSGIVGFGRCSECKALWDYLLITNRFFRHCPRCGAKIENSPFKDGKEMEVEQ